MFEEENSSRYYNNELNVDNDRAGMDLVDLILDQQVQQIDAERQLEYYQEFTDYEEKKLTEKLNYKKQEFLDHVNSRIDKHLPVEEKKKKRKKVLF